MEDRGTPIEILLIEDNEGDIILTQKAFQKGKILNNLHVCRDGQEGLDFLFKRNPTDAPTPDLVLLDLNMPKVSGQEVLKTMREDEKLKSIPVVVLTTSNSSEDILRSYQLHANSYIRKPVDFQQFSKVIQQIEDYWFTIVKLPPKP